jgi:hypothetical protein
VELPLDLRTAGTCAAAIAATRGRTQPRRLAVQAADRRAATARIAVSHANASSDDFA